MVHLPVIRFDSQGVDAPEDLDTLADVVTYCADINFDLTEEEKAAVIRTRRGWQPPRHHLKRLDRLIEFMSE